MDVIYILVFVLIATIFFSLIFGWLLAEKQVNQFSEEIIESQNDINKIPPFLINLIPATDKLLANPSIFINCRTKLTNNSFQSCGFFTAESENIHLEGFIHSEGYYAVLIEHPNQGIYIETVALINDQKLVSISSLSSDEMECPPNAPIFYLGIPAGTPGLVGQLTNKLKEEIKNSEIHLWAKKEFPQIYQNIYKRRMDWLMQRGGPTIDEIKKRALKKGRPEPDFEEIQTIKDNWQIAIIGHVEDETKKAYRTQNEIPEEQWLEIRDRIFIIHEYSSEDNLATDITYSQMKPHETEDSQFEDEFEKKVQLLKMKLSGRDYNNVLVELNESFPKNKRFEKLAELEAPYKATIYLRPAPEV